MTLTDNQTLVKKPLFNPNGDLDVRDRRMIGGNTTNLNDFNNMKGEGRRASRSLLKSAPRFGNEASR